MVAYGHIWSCTVLLGPAWSCLVPFVNQNQNFGGVGPKVMRFGETRALLLKNKTLPYPKTSGQIT